MASKPAEILIIVEGSKTEVTLLNRLIEVYNLSSKFEITSYGTHIYALYHSMFRGKDPSDLDIRTHLRSREDNEVKKALLEKKFTDIFLIFDLDPHDSQYSPQIIREMMAFFNESTEMGKLYINYPMIESFYHMKCIPDADFNTYSINMDKLSPKNQYKEIINQICPDPRKFAASRQECTTVINQNIEKAHHRKGHTSEEQIPEAANILEAQLNKLHNENSIAVLCTCAFYIAEYSSKLLD
ncbi:MAG: hypothetical protein FWE42_03655 [Defluviitaleaceae bacterium]|nr:hypothetical protein [Defluviitaleaceae bacterium]